MLVKTRYFGEIDLAEDKIITFENGIMGFEDYKRYTILFDNEGGETPVISWFQSLDDERLAIPVINPLIIKEDYNPTVEDASLVSLGELTDENLIILLTMTIPSDIKQMTVNLKAPLIINSTTKKGAQIIVENKDYEVKHKVYDKFLKLKEQKGAE
ncbi:flagellar assembly protein FliW [Velocimicrobium porci]|uniref:Flagellar assembly factor FliW n=1 Tax=Velocimicrobium porci TaxID=2606634 RepID=A0A6L5Y138_9FIRM|nr:flagellar assembly protein FliW [Velocimicrobium porci]MSS63873.1 flagellar assembly protein FliW [Velocimicrobium porci]